MSSEDAPANLLSRLGDPSQGGPTSDTDGTTGDNPPASPPLDLEAGTQDGPADEKMPIATPETPIPNPQTNIPAPAPPQYVPMPDSSQRAPISPPPQDVPMPGSPQEVPIAPPPQFVPIFAPRVQIPLPPRDVPTSPSRGVPLPASPQDDARPPPAQETSTPGTPLPPRYIPIPESPQDVPAPPSPQDISVPSSPQDVPLPDSPFVPDDPETRNASRARCPRCPSLGTVGGPPVIPVPGPVGVNVNYTDPYKLHQQACPTVNVIIPYQSQLASLTKVHQLAQKSFHEAFHLHWPGLANERTRNWQQIKFEVAEVDDGEPTRFTRGCDVYYTAGGQRSFAQHVVPLFMRVVKLRNAVAHPGETRPLTGGSKERPHIYTLFAASEELTGELGDQARLDEILKIKRNVFLEAHRIHDDVADFVELHRRTRGFEYVPSVVGGFFRSRARSLWVMWSVLWRLPMVDIWREMTSDQRTDVMGRAIRTLRRSDLLDPADLEASVDYINSRLLGVGGTMSPRGIYAEMQSLLETDPEDSLADVFRKAYRKTLRLILFRKVLRRLLPGITFENHETANGATFALLLRDINGELWEGEPFMANEALSILQTLHTQNLIKFEGDATTGMVTCIADMPDILDATQRKLLDLPDHIQSLLQDFANKGSLETNLKYSNTLVDAALLWRSAYLNSCQDDKFIKSVITTRTRRNEGRLAEQARLDARTPEERRREEAEAADAAAALLAAWAAELGPEQAAINRARAAELEDERLRQEADNRNRQPAVEEEEEPEEPNAGW